MTKQTKWVYRGVVKRQRKKENERKRKERERILIIYKKIPKPSRNRVYVF